MKRTNIGSFRAAEIARIDYSILASSGALSSAEMRNETRNVPPPPPPPARRRGYRSFFVLVAEVANMLDSRTPWWLYVYNAIHLNKVILKKSLNEGTSSFYSASAAFILYSFNDLS